MTKKLRQIVESMKISDNDVIVNSIGTRHRSYVVHAVGEGAGVRVGQHVTHEQIDSMASQGHRVRMAANKQMATASTPEPRGYHVVAVGSPEHVFHVVSVGKSVSKDHVSPGARIDNSHISQLKKHGYKIKHP